MHGTDPGIVLGLYRARPTCQLIETALELGIQHVDTAPGYQHGRGHHDLAAAAGDLLPKLTVSTKVGFFPDGHSLAPARLRRALEQSCISLGQPPGIVFLHNPETSLGELDILRDRDVMAEACATLANAANTGHCGGWGISTWNPRPLLGAVPAVERPDVLMTRAGLTVNASTLDAINELTQRLLPHAAWGMAPFGGNANDPAWKEVEPHQFLRAGQSCTDVQAVFATAYGLPDVNRVAVGTRHPAHLRALTEAAHLEIEADVVARYREILSLRSAATR